MVVWAFSAEHATVLKNLLKANIRITPIFLVQWFRTLICCSLNEQTFSNARDPLICEDYKCETLCFALKNVAARNMEPSCLESVWKILYYCSKVFHFVVNWDSDFFCLFVFPQDSLQKTKQTRWILERSHPMSYPKYACISPTRSAILTALRRFLNSQLHLKLHWNFWWLQTS